MLIDGERVMLTSRDGLEAQRRPGGVNEPADRFRNRIDVELGQSIGIIRPSASSSRATAGDDIQSASLARVNPRNIS